MVSGEGSSYIGIYSRWSVQKGLLMKVLYISGQWRKFSLYRWSVEKGLVVYVVCAYGPSYIGVEVVSQRRSFLYQCIGSQWRRSYLLYKGV